MSMVDFFRFFLTFYLIFLDSSNPPRQGATSFLIFFFDIFLDFLFFGLLFDFFRAVVYG